MLLLYMLIIWQAQQLSQQQFNMYNTEHVQDGYCLFYTVPDFATADDERLTHPTQLIPYCLRPLKEHLFTENFNNTFSPYFTFSDLQESNFTTEMLLFWGASLDVAERYQIFLNNASYLSSLFAEETLVYYCEPPWFGPFCRFSFDVSFNVPFDTIVANYFQLDSSSPSKTQGTCYRHLDCKTPLICLDWREICDRKIDCLDGLDELHCGQLEMNECGENEYRCHNGQCIPLVFFHDIARDPDCLDRTDEPVHFFDPVPCPNDPAFRCEEHTCRPGPNTFPCGDGECIYESGTCQNGRDNQYLNDLCSNAVDCRSDNDGRVDFECCKNVFLEMNYIEDDSDSSFVFEFPPGPVLFGHVRFMFENTQSAMTPDRFHAPDYICYDEGLCASLFPVTVYVNNSTCRHFHQLVQKNTDTYRRLHTLIEDIKARFRTCSLPSYEIQECHQSTMYQCKNTTKCVSLHRVVDSIQDCPLRDDETFDQSCSLNDKHRRFQCLVDQISKCFAAVTIENEINDCTNEEDEYKKTAKLSEKHIYFQIICNGKQDLLPIIIDGRNETDETECEHWPCNNTYSRCDGYWLCKDGADEINCPPSTCPAYEHSCVFPNDTSKVSCLPIAQINDGIIDCLGAMDERTHCRTLYQDQSFHRFHCWNDTTCVNTWNICDRDQDCQFGDDEAFCTNYGAQFDYICSTWSAASLTEVENLLCKLKDIGELIIYLSLRNVQTYPLQLATVTASPISSTQMNSPSIPLRAIRVATDRWCNRGIIVYTRMSGDHCLCPPSYYGDQCQYQNQRVSLTLQIRVMSDWRSLFTLLITLISNEGNIESHDSIQYLPIAQCDTKFSVYLLYSTRPKDPSKNYSVRIDVFNGLTLNYRNSWIFPVEFTFLPVYRLSVLIKVPLPNARLSREHPSPCIHGRYFNSVHSPNLPFCLCDPGWSGAQCATKHRCDCASGSLCISESICLCPAGRFGRRCHLQIPCPSEACLNGGQCVPSDARYTLILNRKLMCICPREYSGERCEHQQTRIDVTFDKHLTIPSTLLVHLIRVQSDAKHIRKSVMKAIAFDEDSLSLYVPIPFNIALAEMFARYYLIIIREVVIVSANISTQIIPSRQCVHINELLNETLANLHLLQRIKYYHIPCHERAELVCFHDSTQICLCDLTRQVNCFEFESQMVYDCPGYDLCENGGQCFLDDTQCPTQAMCSCQQCYYGSRCQLSTKGSTLSLDTILGYHIRPNTAIGRQPTIVIVAIAVTITMFILGFLSGIFSCVTFQARQTRDVGCGLYLFTSSITSITTVFAFALKLALLLAAQTGSNENKHVFVYVQCISMEILLRLLLSTGDWLSACVAIERAVSICQGIHFDKEKSKRIARRIVPAIFFCTTSTFIHDPIHRHLVHDEEEQRTWCVTQYPPFLRSYDWILNILHFSFPFAINCISGVIIIITAARMRLHAHKNHSYKQHLCKQFRTHQHLLISPLILILLAVPRLIISFSTGCMKSARDPWLYLIGYFISFIPPMLIFVVFILPSDIYKKAFSSSIKQICRR